MKRLTRKLATKWTHEVACWLEYERVQGTMQRGRWDVCAYLRGACLIASCILQRVLKVHGYQAGVVQVPGHFFVTTACGWVLDPTHSQFTFRGPRIELHTKRPLPGDVGIVPHLLLHISPGWDADSWSGHHVTVMERILRRMGVDGLEASS